METPETRKVWRFSSSRFSDRLVDCLRYGAELSVFVTHYPSGAITWEVVRNGRSESSGASMGSLEEYFGGIRPWDIAPGPYPALCAGLPLSSYGA